MGAVKDFNPSKYGLTWEEWNKLSLQERERFRRRAYHHACKARDPEYHNKAKRRYLSDPAKRANKNANDRKSYYRHHAKQIERFHKRNDIIRSKQTVRVNPDKVYLLLQRAVSRSLPQHIRDDLISTMCLAVLEGKLLVENIDKEARKYVTDYNRVNDTYKNVSLDAPINGDGFTRGQQLGIY